MLEATGIHEKEFASLTEKSEKLDVEVTSVKESLKKEQVCRKLRQLICI